jgi:hypothetical protein
VTKHNPEIEALIKRREELGKEWVRSFWENGGVDRESVLQKEINKLDAEIERHPNLPALAERMLNQDAKEQESPGSRAVAAKPFDEHLYTLKLREPCKWLHAETVARRRKMFFDQRKTGQALQVGLPKLVDTDIEVLREHLPKVDKACRETWLCDHEAITPAFIRTVLIPHIFTTIAARKGSIKGNLELLARRTRIGGTGLTPALHHLVWEIQHLMSDLATQYEIEAVELSKQAGRNAGAVSMVSTVPATHSIGASEQSDGETKSKADQWRNFHEKFQALTDEELKEGAEKRDRFLRAYFTYRKSAEIAQVQRDARWSFALFGGSDKLPSEPKVINIRLPAHGPFCLLRMPECGLWTLSEGVNENYSERIQTLGARAGVALGCPKGTDPLDFWLHRLTLDLRANDSSLLFGEEKGEDGIILRLSEASATFCSRLERKALEAPALSPQREVIRRKPERGNPEVAKRRSLVKSNPNASAGEMCEIFDRVNVPLPRKWQDAGFQKWSRACKDANYRSRIDVLISKDRRNN